jgi:lipopolysaccharide transport system permease protein
MRKKNRFKEVCKKYAPWAPIAAILGNEKLIYRLAEREIQSRYRGSILGVVWLFAIPIVMLSIYTFVFSVVFQAKWQMGGTDSKLDFAFLLFAGLSVYNLFAESIGRAPTLVLDNPSYVKKVVFPLHILPWVAIVVSLFNCVISLGLLLIAIVFFRGPLPETAWALPFVLLPVILLSLGGSWFVASFGVYVRDVRHIIGVLLTMVMFLSPIFYPISAVPEDFKHLLIINPLVLSLEGIRSALFQVGSVTVEQYVYYTVIAYLFAWLGFIWFRKTEKGFADVM